MKISNKVKVSYGIGAVGKDMVYALVSGFLMYYYNDTLGVSATFIGVLFMAARIFDALNDPIMGVIVEKTNTRMGKYRPWLMIGTLTNAVVLYFLFAIPDGITGTGMLVYLSIAYVLWGVTYTVMDIPYWSMIPAITQPGRDRENISVIARSCAGLGYAIPIALTMILVPVLGNGDEKKGFALLALGVAIVFVVSIIITVRNVRELNTAQPKAARVKDMLISLMKNDQALVVVVGIIIFNAALYLTQQLAIYFFKYDIGNAELVGLFGTVGGVAQILSMTTLPVLRKRFGSMQILTAAIVTTIAGYTFMFLLSAFNVINLFWLCIAAIIIFVGYGLATVLTTIFLADTVDYGEWKNESRNESVVFSLQTFVVKLASAISVLIAGIGLDVIKLNPEAATQSGSTLLGLRVLMLVIPMGGLLFSIFFFRKKYRLNEEKMAEINADLKKRNEG